jgi:hypothetical protein
MATVENLQPEKITVMEVEQRLRATLKGAFEGPPTQRKDMRKSPAKKKAGAREANPRHKAISSGT